MIETGNYIPQKEGVVSLVKNNYLVMMEILFSVSLFLTGGNIIDTKLNLHKYEKDNFKEIFYLKNKDSVNAYCVKHSELENVKKIKYHHHNDGQKTNYKVSKPTDHETKIK